MSTLNIPEPNTTVAKLHISRDSASREQIVNHLEDYLKEHSEAPSGATVIEGTGLWFPEDHEDEVEENLIIEIWIDTEAELEHMKELKADLEEEFDQHCVCLSLENRYYKH